VSGTTQSGWYPDPTATFDHRYWDGTSWTSHVSTKGVLSYSPLPANVLGTPGVGPGTSPSVDPKTGQQVADPGAVTAPQPWQASGGPTPTSATGEAQRRRVILIGAGVAAAALLLGVVEYRSEASELSAYRDVAAQESANRQEVLRHYQARDDALTEVVGLQHEVEALVSEMEKSDCFGSDTCSGAARWNQNTARLEGLFESIASLESSNQAAVNEINDVVPPDGLWLLSMLGKNDSDEDQATLSGYAASILDTKSSINQKIASIEKWNDGCVESEIISCGTRTPLETES